MHTNGQRLLNQGIASRALLRGVLRVNRYKLATSTFSLVTNHSFEHPKACIRSGSSECFALGHKSQWQVFNRYQRIVLGQLVSPPMPKVLALLFDFVVQTGDFVFGLVKAMRALLFSRQRPLSDSKFGKRTLQPARVFMSVPSDKANRAFNPMSIPMARPDFSGLGCWPSSPRKQTYQRPNR